MNVPREQVSAALFNLLKTAYPWVKSARAAQMWDAVGSTNQPYMAVFAVGNEAKEQARALTRWRMKFVCLVYLRADQSQVDAGTTVETTINQIIDAVDAALVGPIKGERQTLGGLVEHAWIEGEIFIDTGIVDQQCAILIPILASTGI